MAWVKKVKTVSPPVDHPGNCPLCGHAPIVYIVGECECCGNLKERCPLANHVFNRAAWDQLVALKVAADKYEALCKG